MNTSFMLMVCLSCGFFVIVAGILILLIIRARNLNANTTKQKTTVGKKDPDKKLLPVLKDILLYITSTSSTVTMNQTSSRQRLDNYIKSKKLGAIDETTFVAARDSLSTEDDKHLSMASLKLLNQSTDAGARRLAQLAQKYFVAKPAAKPPTTPTSLIAAVITAARIDQKETTKQLIIAAGNATIDAGKFYDEMNKLSSDEVANVRKVMNSLPIDPPIMKAFKQAYQVYEVAKAAESSSSRQQAAMACNAGNECALTQCGYKCRPSSLTNMRCGPITTGCPTSKFWKIPRLNLVGAVKETKDYASDPLIKSKSFDEKAADCMHRCTRNPACGFFEMHGDTCVIKQAELPEQCGKPGKKVKAKCFDGFDDKVTMFFKQGGVIEKKDLDDVQKVLTDWDKIHDCDWKCILSTIFMALTIVPITSMVSLGVLGASTTALTAAGAVIPGALSSLPAWARYSIVVAEALFQLGVILPLDVYSGIARGKQLSSRLDSINEGKIFLNMPPYGIAFFMCKWKEDVGQLCNGSVSEDVIPEEYK